MKSVRRTTSSDPKRLRRQRKRTRSFDQAGSVERREHIILAASRHFARNGFDATSMRDIAEDAGILAGSLYHHFNSKEELYVAAHAAGLEVVTRAVLESLESVKDPWDRLEAAAITHCTMLVGDHPLVFTNPQIPSPSFEVDFRGVIVRQRDDYERIFQKLIDNLPLPPDLDRRLYRLHFLGALNWVPQWYKPSLRLAPIDIGRGLVRMLHGL
jgi:TetR/AcrR family transcriptional regulator, cholesterol catabolism regulator